MTKKNYIRLIAAQSLILMLTASHSARARVWKMVPVPAEVQSLQLHQPFTITYAVLARGYDHGPAAPKKLRETLSYDGTRLLFRTEDMATHIIHTDLYNNGETYQMDSNSRIAQIVPGFDFSRMLFCPLPAVGIPHVPFLTGGLLAKTMPGFRKMLAPAQGSEATYINKKLYNTPGQTRDYGSYSYTDQAAVAYEHFDISGIANVVTVPSIGVPKVLWYDTFNNIGPEPSTLWEFYDHKRFQGLWIGTRMRLREMATMLNSRKNVVMLDATYNLESAVSGSLAPNAYDPATYLLEHANVTDFTGSAHKSFVYYKGKGSLEAQRGNGIDVAEALAVNAKSKTNSGLIGLLAVIIMTIVWFVWRRKVTNNES